MRLKPEKSKEIRSEEKRRNACLKLITCVSFMHLLINYLIVYQSHLVSISFILKKIPIGT